jgi:hypothetical protein
MRPHNPKDYTMLNTVKAKAVSTKNHIHRNRGKYAAGVTFIAMTKLHMIAVSQWTEFLEEKGIDPMEFLNPEYFEELQNS